MSDASVFEEYRNNPTLATLSEVVRVLRAHNKFQEMRETLLAFYEKFALNEQIWLEWLKDESDELSAGRSTEEVFESLLGLALNDFPMSVPLHKFKIEHARDKLEAVKSSVQFIGDFDSEIWNQYRELCPNEVESIWKMQLSRPVPDYERILGEYEMEMVMNGWSKFDPLEETMKVVKLLQLHKYDFQKAGTALQICNVVPERNMFERALSYHPHLASLWSLYLSKFPSVELSARAVRFCPESGMLWSLRAKITNEISFNGFNFIKSPFEAQMLLGKLVTIDPSKAVETIKAALKLPIFSEGDEWIWPTLLRVDYMKRMKAPIERQQKVIAKAVARNNQNITLWMKLVDISAEVGGESAARDVFRRASRELKLHVPEIMQRWLAFEACSSTSHYDEVLDRINELTDREPAGTVSGQYEKRTIFVANLDGKCTQDDLQKLFAQAGEVERVSLKMKHDQASYAFIQFRNEPDARKAVSMFNGSVFQNKKLDVKPHETQKVLTLFIHYASDASPGDLIKFLRESTGTTNFTVRLANETHDKQNRTRGWGFIDLKSETDALKFMALNGKIFRTQAIKVEVAQQNRKDRATSKKQAPPPAPKPKPKPTPDDDAMRQFFNL